VKNQKKNTLDYPFYGLNSSKGRHIDLNHESPEFKSISAAAAAATTIVSAVYQH
jgi:hypothetical protein